jgi:hypothetical protein
VSALCRLMGSPFRCVVMLDLMADGFAPTTYAEGRTSIGSSIKSGRVRVPQSAGTNLPRSRWSAVVSAICQVSTTYDGVGIDLSEVHGVYALDWVELPDRSTHLRRIQVHQSHLQVVRQSEAGRGVARVLRVAELIVLSSSERTELSSSDVWARCEAFRPTGDLDSPGANTFGTRCELYELTQRSECIPVHLLLAPVHMVHLCVTCNCMAPGMVLSEGDGEAGAHPEHDHSGNARRYLRNDFFIKRRSTVHVRARSMVLVCYHALSSLQVQAPPRLLRQSMVSIGASSTLALTSRSLALDCDHEGD